MTPAAEALLVAIVRPGRYDARTFLKPDRAAAVLLRRRLN
jgi:hypothetical protein